MYPSPATADSSPLSSQHSANFPALLRELDASLLVTTYQAGKVVLVRADGDVANTRFRTDASRQCVVVGQRMRG